MNFDTLKPYVRAISEKEVKSNTALPVRYLVAYQIILVIDGKAILHINDTDYEIEAGDCILIPPNEPHRYTTLSHYREMNISFDPVYTEMSRVRNLSSSIPPDQLPYYRKRYIQENIYVGYDLPLIFKPENFEEYLTTLIEIKEAVKKNNSFVSEVKMLRMLNLFHEKMGIRKSKSTIDICDGIKDYIDANFEKILTLDGISELFEINKFTILRKFKNKFGKSIISYYNEIRLNYAKSALKEGGRTITSVADALHFTDVYTFSKFFKMHTGMPPRSYIKAQSSADGNEN